MSVTEQGLRRVAMSWEDYLALPDEVFAEWVDGEAVMSPRPSARHGAIVLRVGALLQGALPDLEVIAESAVWLPHNRLRGPDVMVVASLPETTWVEDAPILVVEVLSRSTRTEDTVVKAPEYLGVGTGQLWLVDPERRTVDVLDNHDGVWVSLLHLDDAHPAGEVRVGGHGVVPLDLGVLLPR